MKYTGEIWTEQDGVNAKMGHCDHCGEETMVAWRADPFRAEVHGEREESEWCYSCWLNRKEDV